MAWPTAPLALLALVPFALLAGCAEGPAETQALPPADAASAAAAGPEVRTREAEWAASVAASGAAYSFMGSGYPLESVAGANLTGVVIEMAWTPTTALSQEMTLSVWRQGGEEVGRVSGASPLRLALPGGEGAGDLVLAGEPADPGAWVRQPYRFSLAVFRDAPFDAGYAFG